MGEIVTFPPPSEGAEPFDYLRELLTTRRHLDGLIHEEIRRLAAAPNCPDDIADAVMRYAINTRDPG